MERSYDQVSQDVYLLFKNRTQKIWSLFVNFRGHRVAEVSIFQSFAITFGAVFLFEIRIMPKVLFSIC